MPSHFVTQREASAHTNSHQHKTTNDTQTHILESTRTHTRLLSFFHSHTEGKTHSMSLSQSLCVPTYVRMLQVFSLFFCENDSVCLSTLCATLLFFNEGTFEGVKLFIFSMMGWTMEAPLTIHFLNEGVNERGSCSSLSR